MYFHSKKFSKTGFILSLVICAFCVSACGGSDNKGSSEKPINPPTTSDNPSSTTTLSLIAGNLNAKKLGYVGMSVDQFGNSYFLDPELSTVLKMNPEGIVSRIAGLPYQPGTIDGSTDIARFQLSTSSRVAVDHKGNIYISEGARLRKITADGKVSTFEHPQIGNIRDIAIDSADNVYMADYFRNVVWQLSANGSFATFAGNQGVSGDQDGIGSNALFSQLGAIAVDKADHLYVIDGRALRKISPLREVSSLYGVVGNWRFKDGSNTRLLFNEVTSIAVDRDNNLYIADQFDTIHKVSPNRLVSVFLGSDDASTNNRTVYPRSLAISSIDKLYLNERFSIQLYGLNGLPLGTFGSLPIDGNPGSFAVDSLALDAVGNFWIADPWYSSIRSISPSGVITTRFGEKNIQGSINRFGEMAYFVGPRAIAIDKDSNVYVIDSQFSTTIRKITPSGKVSLIEVGFYLEDLTIDNNGNIYALQSANCPKDTPPCWETQILKVSTITSIVTSLPGSNAYHKRIVVDKDGNIYTTSKQQVILKYDGKAKMNIVAGQMDVAGKENGDGSQARLFNPSYLATDSKGNIYIADMNNSVTRKLTPSGYVSTVIDSATMARSFPNAVVSGGGRMVVGSDDTLYIAISPSAIAKVKF